MRSGPKSKAHWMLTPWEAVVLGATVALLGYQLFLHPVAGLANNGDFLRIQAAFGLAPWGFEEKFAVVQSAFRVEPTATRHLAYFTSELIPVGMAVELGQLAREKLNVRAFGAVHGVFFLVALWQLLLASRALRPWPRGAAIGAFLWVFTDLEYTGYFNSLYSEASVLLFFLLLIGVVAGLRNDRWPSARRLLALTVVAGLWVLSKKQTWVFGPVIALSLGGAAWWWRRTREQSLRAPVLCALGLMLTSVLYGSLKSDQHIRDANLFHTVFQGALRHSPDASADLVELGLPAEYVRYVGMHAWHRQSPAWDPAFRAVYYAKVSHGRVVAFYLRHPERLWGLVSEALSEAAVMHPLGIGHFERTQQPTELKLALTTSWSRLKAALAGTFPFLTLAVLVLAAALPLARAARGKPLTPAMLALGVLPVLAGLELFVVVIGDGMYEIRKHLFVFHLLLDASLVGLWTWGVAWVDGRVLARQRRAAVGGQGSAAEEAAPA